MGYRKGSFYVNSDGLHHRKGGYYFNLGRKRKPSGLGFLMLTIIALLGGMIWFVCHIIKSFYLMMYETITGTYYLFLETPVYTTLVLGSFLVTWGLILYGVWKKANKKLKEKERVERMIKEMENK